MIHPLLLSRHSFPPRRHPSLYKHSLLMKRSQCPSQRSLQFLHSYCSPSSVSNPDTTHTDLMANDGIPVVSNNVDADMLNGAQDNIQTTSVLVTCKSSAFSQQASVNNNSNNANRRPLLLSINKNLQNNNNIGKAVVSGIVKAEGKKAEDIPPPPGYYSIMYTKFSNKKKKIWSDGVLTIHDRGRCEIFDSEGKSLNKTNIHSNLRLKVGETLCVSGKDIEVMQIVDEAAFQSGHVFSGVSSAVTESVVNRPSKSQKLQMGKFKPVSIEDSAGNDLPVRTVKPKCSLFSKDVPGTILLTANFPDKIVDVVVDPHLGRHCRPHQVQGVQFLFDCVMGVRSSFGKGCILADAMGLGKSLQAICLIWTLLNQGPYGTPVIKKTIIVCPSSLIGNWCKEFSKWLGTARCDPIFLSSATAEHATLIKEFHFGHRTVLILSYEQCRKHADLLSEAGSRCDLLICDEGHRLKNSLGTQTSKALQALRTDRRVILSGTPIQNDLEEFYALVSFCCPNLLGSLPMFQNVYANAISKSRDSDCSEEEKRMGEARSRKLYELTGSIILRRTAEILDKYLPDKREISLFCCLSTVQMDMYKRFLRSKPIQEALLGREKPAQVLRLILNLRKICNYPTLCQQISTETTAALDDDENDDGQTVAEIDPLLSGKLLVTHGILKAMWESDVHEKIIIVSNYTKTLNILEKLCELNGYPVLRLDGATEVSKRMSLVNRFNSPDIKKTRSTFIFLLSSRAGGVGLNLIGAAKLVMFDCDWNPSIDAQAQARIWRDGQKRIVTIYRLFSTGTIEEKMYQRQISKEGLSNVVVDDTQSSAEFSRSELKDLFKLDSDCRTCDTHVRMLKSDSSNFLETWSTYENPLETPDDILTRAIKICEECLKSDEAEIGQQDVISFVFFRLVKGGLGVSPPSEETPTTQSTPPVPTTVSEAAATSQHGLFSLKNDDLDDFEGD